MADTVKLTARSAPRSMLHAENLKPAAGPWSRSPVTTGAVAALGDAALLFALLSAGVPAGTAGMVSLLTTTLGLVLLRSVAGEATASHLLFMRAGRLTVVVWLTVFLRAGVLAWMLRIPGCPLIVTAAVSAIVAGLLLHTAFALDSTGAPATGERAPSRDRTIALLVVYAIALRLIYAGLPELIHEEAYYWNYSRHLALGYLDHPPMVGWIIRAFTVPLGHTELAVRAGAFSSWLLGGWFIFRLTRRIYDTVTANCALLLFALLPAYFTFGFVMTPEAPLYACWAGALYFLYKALVDEQSTAWLGAGAFMGAGMLTKYTMALLGAAVIVFMLASPRSRHWFRKGMPWLAAGLALLMFTPVVVWNFQHDWISFAFQGPQRLAGDFGFNLPALIGYAAALLTPVGLAAAIVVLFSRRQLCAHQDPGQREHFMAGFRLLAVSTLVPLAVFVAFSLFRFTKLNWTGPLWLGLLPYMARMMASPWRADAGRWRTWLSTKTWTVTAVLLLLVYAAGLQYLTLGLWGLPYPQNATGMVALGWRDLGVSIERVVERVAQESGRSPLVVGMEGDRLSSWLAFYRSPATGNGATENTGAAALDTAGPHLFGFESHMYSLWFPNSAENEKRPMLLVGASPSQLDVRSARPWAGPVREVAVGKNGQPTWRLYYRVLK